MLKPSAQTHTAAPHCGSHCHPAPRSVNTASSLLLQARVEIDAAMKSELSAQKAAEVEALQGRMTEADEASRVAVAGETARPVL